MSWIVNRDGRTLFQRAWSHGVASGIITEEIEASIIKEGTRAILKIADILGTRRLRSDLERAMRSMLGLADLHLEHVSRGNLTAAAHSLADQGLLFHTRGASQAIKRIRAVEDGLDPDRIDPATMARYEADVVAAWAQFPYEVFVEQQARARVGVARRAAAAALAAALGVDDPDDLLLAYPADSVLMTALLAMTWSKKPVWPATPQDFEQIFTAVRQSPRKLASLPAGVPTEHAEAVEGVRAEFAAKVISLITDTSFALHLLADGLSDKSPLLGLVAFADDALAGVEDLSEATTSHWQALTGGATDDEERLLAVMLAAVPGIDAPVPMSLTVAVKLLRTRLTARPDDERIERWLDENAPHEKISGLMHLWDTFWQEREYLDAAAGDNNFRAFAKMWLLEKPAPGTKTVAAKTLAAGKPAASKPAAKKPAAKKPASKKPAAKTPAAKKPAAKKPVARKVPAKKPAA